MIGASGADARGPGGRHEPDDGHRLGVDDLHLVALLRQNLRDLVVELRAEDDALVDEARGLDDLRSRDRRVWVKDCINLYTEQLGQLFHNPVSTHAIPLK